MTETIYTRVPAPATEYSVQLIASLRNFVRNTADISIGVWNININHISEFIPQVWEKARPHIARGVIFTTAPNRNFCLIVLIWKDSQIFLILDFMLLCMMLLDIVLLLIGG